MPRERSPRHRVAPSILRRSRELRQSTTEPEQRLWHRLRNHGLGFHFRRQHVLLGRFLPDFHCADARLCIEIDGDGHSEPTHMAYDADRSRLLLAKGYRVLRFTNRQVMDELEAVLRAIEEACRGA